MTIKDRFSPLGLAVVAAITPVAGVLAAECSVPEKQTAAIVESIEVWTPPLVRSAESERDKLMNALKFAVPADLAPAFQTYGTRLNDVQKLAYEKALTDSFIKTVKGLGPLVPACDKGGTSSTAPGLKCVVKNHNFRVAYSYEADPSSADLRVCVSSEEDNITGMKLDGDRSVDLQYNIASCKTERAGENLDSHTNAGIWPYVDSGVSRFGGREIELYFKGDVSMNRKDKEERSQSVKTAVIGDMRALCPAQ